MKYLFLLLLPILCYSQTDLRDKDTTLVGEWKREGTVFQGSTGICNSINPKTKIIQSSNHTWVYNPNRIPGWETGLGFIESTQRICSKCLKKERIFRQIFKVTKPITQYDRLNFEVKKLQWRIP